MKLWTIQPLPVWQTIEKTGVYRCDPALAMQEFEHAYRWLAEQMRRRIGPPPEGVVYPVWAWYRWNGLCKKPDLRAERWCCGGGDEDYVCIGVDMPGEQVLLSDFDTWHFVLMQGEISWTKEEEAEQEALLQTMNPAQRSKYLSRNWERVFDLTCRDDGWVRSGKWVQATFWELQKSQVLSVQHFRTAKRKRPY